jgi:hypothetical protein
MIANNNLLVSLNTHLFAEFFNSNRRKAINYFLVNNGKNRVGVPTEKLGTTRNVVFTTAEMDNVVLAIDTFESLKANLLLIQQVQKHLKFKTKLHVVIGNLCDMDVIMNYPEQLSYFAELATMYSEITKVAYAANIYELIFHKYYNPISHSIASEKVRLINSKGGDIIWTDIAQVCRNILLSISVKTKVKAYNKYKVEINNKLYPTYIARGTTEEVSVKGISVNYSSVSKQEHVNYAIKFDGFSTKSKVASKILD